MQQRLECLGKCAEQLLARYWRAIKNFSPTPRRPRRQNHPNLFLLGFRPKLMTIAYFQKKHSPRIRFVARSRLTGLAGGTRGGQKGQREPGADRGADGGQREAPKGPRVKGAKKGQSQRPERRGDQGGQGRSGGVRRRGPRGGAGGSQGGVRGGEGGGGQAGPGGARGGQRGQGGARGRRGQGNQNQLFEHPLCLAWPEAPWSLDTLRWGLRVLLAWGPWGTPPRNASPIHSGSRLWGLVSLLRGPALVPGRTCSGTGPIVGATDSGLQEAGKRPGSKGHRGRSAV